MSILIKGMEMPKRCLDCPFLITRDNDDCILQSDEANAKFESWDDMKASCPLIELPPHGRLIDADEFKADYGMKNECADCEKELKGKMKSCEYDRIYSKMDFCQWLDNAEAVIEGSET